MALRGKCACAVGGALLLGALMLRFADAAVSGAAEGLRRCGCTVIPSLFPFFVLSNLLLNLRFGAKLPRPLRALFQRGFGVSASGAGAFVFGLLGGYPLGASTVAQLYVRREISRQDAQRLLRFCNNTGPSFFVGTVGVAVFGSVGAGLALYAIHAVSAVLTGLLLRRPQGRGGCIVTPSGAQALPFGRAFSEAVTAACQSMLNISAFVVFFSALLSVLEQSGALRGVIGAMAAALPLPQTVCQSLLLGSLELTGGVLSLSACGRASAFCLAEMIVTWGGMCVHFQSLSQLSAVGLPTKGYVSAKLLQTLLAGLLAASVCAVAAGRSIGLLVLGILAVLLLFAKILQKKGGICRRNPV